MPNKLLHITGITGGRAEARFSPRAGEFTTSAGIDPDLPLGSAFQSSGIAVPSRYAKFSTANVAATAVAFITQPKTNKIYVVLSNGKLLSYTSAFASETVIGTFAGANCGGACYYNNYIYAFGTGSTMTYGTQTVDFTVGQTLTGGASGATATIASQTDRGVTGTLVLTNIVGTFQSGEAITDSAGGSALSTSTVTGKTDVSRYGPLNNIPYFENAWWSGLGLAPLADTTYPTVRNVSLPNHWGFVHGDNSLYFLDFANGQGLVHRIHTEKVTYEGDTNSSVIPSAYNVLDLPLGFYPTALCSYGTNVAIAAVQSVDSVFGLNQGTASLFIWNPTNTDTFEQQINFPDQAATALVSRFGHLIAFSGSLSRGVRISEYVGGTTFQEQAYIEDGASPFPGAVDTYGHRVYFGSYCLDPLESATVWAMGSRTSTKANDVHSIAVVGTQTPNVDALVTAIKITGQQNGRESTPEIIVAATSGSTKELYAKSSTGNIGSCFETPIINVGANFRINRLRIPLGSKVASGTVISVRVIYDDGESYEDLNPINNTTYPGASRVTYKASDVKGSGENNFRLRFDWTNATAETAINFPIDAWVEVTDDESNSA